jgi:hypothetical protein
VEIARGLLEPKHREALGPAIFLYLWLLSTKPYKSPMAMGGRPIALWVMATACGSTDREIRRWLARLRKRGYIRTELVNSGLRSKCGVRVRILKAKEWKGPVMRVHHDPPPPDKNVLPPPDKNVRGFRRTSKARNRLQGPSSYILESTPKKEKIL